MKRTPFIAGNWKMNGTREQAAKLSAAIKPQAGVDVVLCPPFLHISAIVGTCAIGAQDVSDRDDGAFTGDVSAKMLADMGCRYVIVGHSERRQYHRETDALVSAKAAKAMEAGLIPIICVGETKAEREAGLTEAVIETQIAGSVPAGATGQNIVIAYEPVWAIGTGLVASIDQIAQVHAQIRGLLEKRLADGGILRIIYGGSVKADNAAEILGLDDVDGALVGGASLKAESFVEIIRAVKV
jgi:triosephosphate isomerase